MKTGLLPEIQAPETAPPIEPAEDFVMVSSMDQQRWWTLDQLAPENPAFNVPFAVELRGPLDVDALEKALKAVIHRHEALRTSFSWLEGEVKQVIASEVPFVLHQKDFSSEPKSQRAEIVLREMNSEARTPLTLKRAPIARVCLVKFDTKDHLLIFTLHHIICDGWANGVILREMGEYYQAFVEGRPAELPELPIQYADYAMWQRDWMKTPDFDDQVTFWEKMLTGGAPMLDFPTDHPRRAGPGHKFPGYMENHLLPIPLTDRVKRLCQDFDATLFMVFFATYAIILHRYTSQDRFIVGTSMANRPRPELENLIGQFANPMMLRVEMEDNPTFRELMPRIRDMLLGAMSHQDVPLESILERLELKSAAREKPAIQAIVMFQKDFLLNTQHGDLEIRPLRWVSPGTVIELTLGIVERAEGICLHMEYNPNLLENSTICRFLDHYEKLLEAVLENPDTPVSELAILTDAERAKLWPPPVLQNSLPDNVDPQIVIKNLKRQLDEHFEEGPDLRAALLEPPPGAILVVLDRHLRLVPPGIPGQLYLGGIAPEAVPGAALVSGPLDATTPVSLLRTDFVAQNRADGKIELLGQDRDFAQVGGFRTNLRIIKTLLLRHPDVREVAAVVSPNASGVNQLICYVVPKSNATPTEKDLLAHLRGKINDFTLPAHILIVSLITKNSLGEVIPERLPKPVQAAKPTDNVPLEGILYRQLTEIWLDILKLPSVALDDNFFALGGSSLQAFRMMMEVEKLCGCPMPLTLLLKGATIGNLARYISDANHESTTPLVVLQGKGTKSPLFFLHGDWAGGGFYCERLSQLLGKDQPFYALPPYRLGKQEVMSMEKMAAYHVAAMQAHTPHGPYLLGGYCIGAIVAMEMARQLVKKGEKVTHLLLIDPPLLSAPWLRKVWPMIERMGWLFKWDLQKKIYYFDRYAVSLDRWLKLSPRGKLTSFFHRFGLSRPVVSPTVTGRAAGEGDLEILKSMDYAIYFLAYRLYRLRTVSVPTTLYFPASTRPATLGRVIGKAKAKITVDVLPGDHHTCITKHTPELVEKMKKALDHV